MKFNLLVNPNAGRGRAGQLFPGIARRLEARGVEFDWHFSAGPGHLTELARNLSGRKGGCLVVCGGDGSLNEVLNGLPETGPVLGVIPCGSGNDLARNLGIPRSVAQACDLLEAGTVRTIDVAAAGVRRYLGIGGAGFDAEVNRRANNTRLHIFPRAVYTWQVLSTLRSFRPREFFITADGWRYEGRIMFVAVANTPAYGGGMRISPGSRMDDGCLEVCIVEEMGRLELLANFPSVFGGRHLDHPRFRVLPATRVRIESAARGDFYADGEFHQPLPVEIAVRPAAARLLAAPLIPMTPDPLRLLSATPQRGPC